LLPLLFSKTFIDFTTSGLENSLSYLLFAIFGYLLARHPKHPYFWFYCTLTVSFALLTRLDTAVLYAPPLLYLVCTQWRSIRWKHIALGALPLMLWAAFSLFYYGFFFPNTKYAKLNTEIGIFAYIGQGFVYFIELFSSDALSFMLLVICFVLAIEYVKDSRKCVPQATVLLSVNLGAIAYMGYVVFVGGDFMSGRFWSLPIFVTVWLLYAYIPPMGNRRILSVIAFLVVLKCLSLNMAKDSLVTCGKNEHGQPFAELGYCVKQGIVDEKQFYHPYDALFDKGQLSFSRWERHENAITAKEARQHPQNISLNHMVGVFGYYAGPDVIIVDDYAITDPLLARLPSDASNWRIGHFPRSIPAGYLEAVRTGNTQHMPPALAAYYQPLRLITDGALWGTERLKAIIEFHLGRYDHYRRDYLMSLHTP
jgi:arabinofuranosyltransferase